MIHRTLVEQHFEICDPDEKFQKFYCRDGRQTLEQALQIIEEFVQEQLAIQDDQVEYRNYKPIKAMLLDL